MIGIEELSARVAEAEQRFGLIGEEHAKYSARLVSLLDTVESRLREQEAKVLQQAEANAALQDERDEARSENEQLRDMLLSLLRAVENGGRDHVMQTMQTLETRVSGLVTTNPPEAQADAADPSAASAESETSPADREDSPADDLPGEIEAEGASPVEPRADPEKDAPAEGDVQPDTASPGEDAMLEEGDPGVSLADIMQRVSDLAGADSDPDLLEPADPATASEGGFEAIPAEDSMDELAEVPDQPAVTTGAGA